MDTCICETCKAKDICNSVNGEPMCIILRIIYK